MSTSGKDRIADYSADYRNANPRGPKAESPQPGQEKPDCPAGNKQKTQTRPRQKPKTVHTEPDRMDNDSEIDDFLPAKDRIDGEQILTKWDG